MTAAQTQAMASLRDRGDLSASPAALARSAEGSDAVGTLDPLVRALGRAVARSAMAGPGDVRPDRTD